MTSLRPYQSESLEAICAARESGTNRVLMQMATGLGKTVTLAAMLRWPAMASWLGTLPKAKGGQMLLVAHREELLDQACIKLQRQNPGLMVSIEQGSRYANSYSDVVVASIQTLAARQYARLKRLTDRHTFRVVVVDECHHATARSYRGCLAMLGFLPTAPDKDGVPQFDAADFDDADEMDAALKTWDSAAPKDRLLVGVTATPNRSDAIGVGAVFQTIAYSYPLKQAIDDKWLVPIVPWFVETVENLDGVKTTAGDFNQKELAKAVNTERRNWLAVKAWQDYAKDVPTIAFTVDVAHAHALASLFQSQGHRFVALSGETPKEDRRLILRQYTEGQIDGITNCQVLSEGTDLPMTACILMTKPTESATVYEQCVGRGLRLHPDKAECVVIDVVDVCRKHSLQTAPVLYGLPPNLKTKGKTLKQTADEVDRFLEEHPGFNLAGAGRFSIEDIATRARKVNVFHITPLAGSWASRKLHWIKVGAEEYRLQYPYGDGIEVLRIAKDLIGKFDLSATIRPANGDPVRQKTIAAHLPSVEMAADLAETFVMTERPSVMKLKRRDAPWRKNPVSSGQRALLDRYRIPYNRHTTSGEAADLIDMAKSARGR